MTQVSILRCVWIGYSLAETQMPKSLLNCYLNCSNSLFKCVLLNFFICLMKLVNQTALYCQWRHFLVLTPWQTLVLIKEMASASPCALVTCPSHLSGFPLEMLLQQCRQSENAQIRASLGKTLSV